mgnify:CR=1 FL=1
MSESIRHLTHKIPKYVFMKMLEIFEKDYNCKTIEDIKNITNKELKNDTDIVFSWKNGEI